MRSLNLNQVVRVALIHYDFRHRHVQSNDSVKTYGGDDHLQAKGRVWEKPTPLTA